MPDLHVQRWLFVVLTCLALVSAPVAAHSATFQVALDTTTIVGQSGKIAFDITSPDPAQNFVSLTTPVFEGGGSIVSKETAGGQSIGGLFDNTGSTTVINDQAIGVGGTDIPEFFTNLTLNVTWGTLVTFTLTVSEQATPGSIPDLFALYLRTGDGQPLYPTGDPLGTGAAFAVSIMPSGPCLFLPATASVPATLTVKDDIGQDFRDCVQGGIVLAKGKLGFGKKPNTDSFSVTSSFVSPAPLDPSLGTVSFFLSRSGVQFVSATGLVLKANKKKTSFSGGGGQVKTLKLTTKKDRRIWKLSATGSKLDLTPADTGANETLGVGFESPIAPVLTGDTPGDGTFFGDETFLRKKTKLKFPK